MKSHPQRLKEAKRHGSIQFPLGSYALNKTGCTVPHHWHNEVELIYIETGTFHLEVQTTMLPSDSPAFYFINSEELHALKTKDDCMERAIVFDLKLLSSESYDYVQSHYIAPLLDKQIRFPRMIPAASTAGGLLLHVFRELQEEYVRQTPVSFIRMKALLMHMIGILAEYDLFDTGPHVISDKAESVKAVLSYIQEHYTEKIYLSDLAATLNFNEQYFCRFFKQIIGKSPIEYLLEYRLEQAAKQLAKTDSRIVDICYANGFENAGYFIRKFKQHYGSTPSNYRKELHQ